MFLQKIENKNTTLKFGVYHCTSVSVSHVRAMVDTGKLTTLPLPYKVPATKKTKVFVLPTFRLFNPLKYP